MGELEDLLEQSTELPKKDIPEGFARKEIEGLEQTERAEFLLAVIGTYIAGKAHGIKGIIRGGIRREDLVNMAPALIAGSDLGLEMASQWERDVFFDESINSARRLGYLGPRLILTPKGKELFIASMRKKAYN